MKFIYLFKMWNISQKYIKFYYFKKFKFFYSDFIRYHYFEKSWFWWSDGASCGAGSTIIMWLLTVEIIGTEGDSRKWWMAAGNKADTATARTARAIGQQLLEWYLNSVQLISIYEPGFQARPPNYSKCEKKNVFLQDFRRL